jgi:hypothetical protein
LCDEAFADTDAFVRHLGDVHGLADDPGTSSQSRSAPREPDPPSSAPSNAGPTITAAATAQPSDIDRPWIRASLRDDEHIVAIAGGENPRELTGARLIGIFGGLTGALVLKGLRRWRRARASGATVPRVHQREFCLTSERLIVFDRTRFVDELPLPAITGLVLDKAFTDVGQRSLKVRGAGGTTLSIQGDYDVLDAFAATVRSESGLGASSVHEAPQFWLARMTLVIVLFVFGIGGILLAIPRFSDAGIGGGLETLGIGVGLTTSGELCRRWLFKRDRSRPVRPSRLDRLRPGRAVLVATALAIVAAVVAVAVHQRDSSTTRADQLLITTCSGDSSSAPMRWEPVRADGLPSETSLVLGDFEYRGAATLMTAHLRDTNGVVVAVPRMDESADGSSWQPSPVDLGADEGSQDVRQATPGNLFPLLGAGRVVTADAARGAAWNLGPRWAEGVGLDHAANITAVHAIRNGAVTFGQRDDGTAGAWVSFNEVTFLVSSLAPTPSHLPTATAVIDIPGGLLATVDLRDADGRLVDQEVWTSTDGRAWTTGEPIERRFSGSGVHIARVQRVGGSLFAMGHVRGARTDTAIWRSDDGTAWTPISLDRFNTVGDEELASLEQVGENLVFIGARTNSSGQPSPLALTWHGSSCQWSEASTSAADTGFRPSDAVIVNGRLLVFGLRDQQPDGQGTIVEYQLA